MIHGGGWCDGDRMGGVAGNLPKCRAADCALVSISYRMVHDANDAGIKPPVKACLDDAVAAIKLVQAKAAEWNIDPTRIGLTGGSAGACSSLYASLQGDNALGIRAVLAHSPQTSLDPQETKEWIPNARYGAHAAHRTLLPGGAAARLHGVARPHVPLQLRRAAAARQAAGRPHTRRDVLRQVRGNLPREGRRLPPWQLR